MARERSGLWREVIRPRNIPLVVTLTAAAIYGGMYAVETSGPVVALFKRPRFHRLSKQIPISERSIATETDRKPITDIVLVGDSMCYPNGEKDASKKPTEHTGSFVQLVADRHPEITAHNFATPGDATSEVLKTLGRQDVVDTVLHTENPILVVSMSGNDYRKFVNHPRVSDALHELPEVLEQRDVRRMATIPSKGIGLSRRHIRTGKDLRSDYLDVLKTVDRLNALRQRNGKSEIAGLVITLPPDFGDAPAIKFVPVAGAEELVREELFILDNPIKRNIASLVANTVALRTLHAYRKFSYKKAGRYPTAVLPMWEIIDSRHFTNGDQHVGPQGQQNLSIGLEHVLSQMLSTPRAA